MVIHPWGGDEEEESEGKKGGGAGGAEVAGEGKGKGKGKARIETFVVGQDIDKGERLQWIVEGGKWKASFLLPDNPDDEGEGQLERESKSGGLLISEVSQPVPVPVPSLKKILKKLKRKKKRRKRERVKPSHSDVSKFPCPPPLHTQNEKGRERPQHELT